MAIKFNRSQTFAINGTVTASNLHNLVDGLDIYQALITDQTNLTSVGTADELLIADADLTPNDAPRAVTVQELFNDALSVGTYADANLTGNFTFGTATGNRTVSTSATITTGTIGNATLGTTTGTAATFTSGTIPTLTAGTTTSTSANITNGTVQTLTASTGSITLGTVGTLNSTTGTIATLNSTTGTIGNFSTTLAGDLTISQGTATLGTTGVTAGTYGTTAVVPRISVDSKGRITTLGTAIGGKVLQVVESTYSTSVAITSTSFADTGLSASITPNFSSSKILVLIQQNYYLTRSIASISHFLGIARTIGTTTSTIYSGDAGVSVMSNSGATFAALGSTAFISEFDSPNSTSTVTYKTQGRVGGGTSSETVTYQATSIESKITLMEIAQ
jgi:hypothetical protein